MIAALALDVALALCVPLVLVLAFVVAVVDRWRRRPCGACGRPEAARKSCWCESR